MTSLRRFLGSRRGAITVLAAFGAMIIAATGAVISDLGHMQLIRGRLQTAVDAAGLAAARSLGADDAAVKLIARQVFDANLAHGLAGGSLTSFEATVGATVDSSTGIKDVVRVKAVATLPLYMALLPSFFGSNAPTSSTISAEAGAVKRTLGAEIALALDNTGSMRGQKIADLKAATKTLVDVLFQGAQSVPDLLIAVAPYSASVNIGRQHAAMLDAPLAQVDAAMAPTRWKGCVRARSVAKSETDDPPTAASRFTAQLWASSQLTWDPDTFDSWHSSSKNVWPQDRNGVPSVDERITAGNSGFGPNLGCPAAITPLTASRADLDVAIAQIGAWSRGGTMSNLGLGWAWRTISPRWRGAWRTPSGTVLEKLPFDYDKPYHNKIVILMTDGRNQFYQKDETAFGRPSALLKPSEVNASMSRVCEAVKKAGIILYTITFGSGASSSSMQNLYRNCASDPVLETRMPGPKYFHAPSGADLEQAFSFIGGQIQELRLIE